jgi:hypothetical protein
VVIAGLFTGGDYGCGYGPCDGRWEQSVVTDEFSADLWMMTVDLTAAVKDVGYNLTNIDLIIHMISGDPRSISL